MVNAFRETIFGDCKGNEINAHDWNLGVDLAQLSVYHICLFAPWVNLDPFEDSIPYNFCYKPEKMENLERQQKRK